MSLEDTIVSLPTFIRHLKTFSAFEMLHKNPLYISSLLLCYVILLQQATVKSNTIVTTKYTLVSEIFGICVLLYVAGPVSSVPTCTIALPSAKQQCAYYRRLSARQQAFCRPSAGQLNLGSSNKWAVKY